METSKAVRTEGRDQVGAVSHVRVAPARDEGGVYNGSQAAGARWRCAWCRAFGATVAGRFSCVRN